MIVAGGWYREVMVNWMEASALLSLTSPLSTCLERWPKQIRKYISIGPFLHFEYNLVSGLMEPAA